MDDKEMFLAGLYPAAIAVSEETGLASQTILAQATQENGWGHHQLSGTHATFDIKADSGRHGDRKTFRVWKIEHKKRSHQEHDNAKADQAPRVYPVEGK